MGSTLDKVLGALLNLPARVSCVRIPRKSRPAIANFLNRQSSTPGQRARRFIHEDEGDLFGSPVRVMEGEFFHWLPTAANTTDLGIE